MVSDDIWPDSLCRSYGEFRQLARQTSHWHDWHSRHTCTYAMLSRPCPMMYKATWKAGAPGEVKWVNFHPHFSEPPSFFSFLSLKYWNNIWFLWFLWLRWRMYISDDRFYQSIYSFWAHKHLNQALFLLHYHKNSPPISKSWIRAWKGFQFHRK